MQLAAQRPLEPLILVRVQAPQLLSPCAMKSGIDEDPPENIMKDTHSSEPGLISFAPLACLYLLFSFELTSFYKDISKDKVW